MKDDRIINCDLDGVLADMDSYLDELMTPGEKDDPNLMWSIIEKHPRFYRKLSPTPYAYKLWEAIKATGLRARVLTALPRRETMLTVEGDKRAWCEIRHLDTVFGGEPPEFLACLYSKNKYKHCRPGDILIDDRLSNCQEWEAAGGVAIHHQGNTGKTIKALHLAVYGVLDDAD